jgi:hypothetical protein
MEPCTIDGGMGLAGDRNVISSDELLTKFALHGECNPSCSAHPIPSGMMSPFSLWPIVEYYSVGKNVKVFSHGCHIMNFPHLPTHLMVCILALVVVTDCSSSTMSARPLDTTVSELKAKAGKGLVRVIVKVRPKVSSAEGRPSDEKEIAAAKSEISRVMQDAQVVLVEPIEGQPFVVMELTANQLDQLQATGLVESIEEDQVDHPF